MLLMVLDRTCSKTYKRGLVGSVSQIMELEYHLLFFKNNPINAGSTTYRSHFHQLQFMLVSLMIIFNQLSFVYSVFQTNEGCAVSPAKEQKDGNLTKQTRSVLGFTLYCLYF